MGYQQIKHLHTLGTVFENCWMLYICGDSLDVVDCYGDIWRKMSNFGGGVWRTQWLCWMMISCNL